MRRVLHILMTTLTLAGFLFQNLWTGVPRGHILCIGYETGAGWTVSEPCDPAAPDCCADEPEAGTPSAPVAVIARGADPCGCIDLPVGDPTMTASVPVRADGPAASWLKCERVEPVLAVVVGRDSTEHPSWWWGRAGPRWQGGEPPRMLVPMARCTVLTV